MKFRAKDNNIRKITYLNILMMYHMFKKIYMKSLKMLNLIEKKIFLAYNNIIKLYIQKDIRIFSFTI